MDRPDSSKQTPGKPVVREPEHEGSIWSHPYLMYVLVTIVLFAGLILAGWMASENGWIPTR